MNGVEAAASLFGSEEPASDPFAALGEPQSSHEDPFLVNGASYSLHSGATAEHSNPIGAENIAASPAFHEYSQQGLHSQNSSYPAAGYAPDLGGGTSQQGWYGESAYDIPEPTFTGIFTFVEASQRVIETATIPQNMVRTKMMQCRCPASRIPTYHRRNW
jgi:hypothetical protein